MEYGALEHNAAAFPEADFIDELFVEGCWLETTVGCGISYNSDTVATAPRALTDPSQSHYLAPPPSNQSNNTAHVMDPQIIQVPKDSRDSQEQKQMLSSLSMLVQQACRSLHLVMEKETEEEFTLPVRDGDGGPVPLTVPHKELELPLPVGSKESSWIAHMMEAQLQESKQEFKVTRTNWDRDITCFSDFGQLEQSSGSRGNVEGGGESYTFGDRRSSSGGRKSGYKRRTKSEKTISLPVLRQYFAGSLKDAAKSIGVCPTTLKRICRQHGITRWPSRKIKKVGHSLRKLQLVIDSVQGAEGAIQIGSFYTSFPELSSKDFSGSGPSESSKINDYNSKQTHSFPHNDNGLYSQGVTTLKSSPSSCSQTSGSSPTISCATAGNQPSTTINNGDVLMAHGFLKRAHSEPEAELHASIQKDTKHFTDTEHPIHIHSLEVLPPLPQTTSGWNSRDREAFRVKATFGDEKICFSLQQNWGFRDLQLEIAKRFNLNEVSNIDLKYLDDDRQWVLLTCDADFEECKDIYRSSQSRTIRLSLFQASPLHLANTFGSSSMF